ncbi:hypothetical protein [Saccharopolyspora sp. 5N708]|uniref:hypothetical protein n=1 Tax=Saccharopolyspora sp. 5N708 TaxID=3457424 RepID=UPI003FCFB195
MGLRQTLAMVVYMLMMVVGFGASAVGLIALLVVGLATPDEGSPTCDGEVMHPGDSCYTSYNGNAHVSSYDEIMQRRESGQRQQQVLIVGGVGLGGGVVLLLGGRWILRWASRDQ